MNYTFTRLATKTLHKPPNLVAILYHTRKITTLQPQRQPDPQNRTAMSSTELPKSSSLAIKALAYARIAVGAGALIAPVFSIDLFGIAMQPPSTILARLLGVRDLVLGAYLLNNCSNFESSLAKGIALEQKSAAATSNDEEAYWLRRELRRAIWLGMMCDMVDVGSCAISVWEGTLAGKGVWLVGGGAVELVILALVGLRKL